MKGWTLILAAIGAATALSLASPLAASDEAAKTPLRIYVAERGGSGTFTLLGASAADSDSGTLTFIESAKDYGKTPDGLLFQSLRHTETLKGKHGTLVIRLTGRSFPVVKNDDFVWIGTWSIVRGTREYAGLTGGGGFVGIIRGSDFSNRYEGFVTRS